MILVDGELDRHVSPLDRGLAYGDGVFRTMRAQAARIPLWARHYRKLAHDCGRLGIACPAEATLLADVSRILAAEPDCVVKIVVTRGQGGRGYAAPEAAQPARVVASFPLPVPPADCDERGVRVRWCATLASEQPALAGVKHLNRLDNVLARSEWNDAAIAEGLMCDVRGQVVSGTASNVFIAEKGRLVTPALDRCGIEGVQRARVIELSRRVCAGCTVEPISRERLLAAEQVYLVNSVIGAWWVGALEDRTWDRSPLTPRLLEALRQEDG